MFKKSRESKNIYKQLGMQKYTKQMQTGLFPRWEIDYISTKTKFICVFSMDKNHWDY